MRHELLREGRCPGCGEVLDTKHRYDAVHDRVSCPCGVTVAGPTLRDALPPEPSPEEKFAATFAEALANAKRGRP